MNRRRILEDAEIFLRNPYPSLRKKAAEDRKYIGRVCLFTPEVVMEAAGFVSVRLFGDYRGPDRSEAFLPSQCCEFVKNLLSGYAAGHADFLSGVVFGFCCDTLQAASALLVEKGYPNVFRINVPTRLDGALAQTYLEAEIRRFIHELEPIAPVSPTPDRIRETLVLHEERDALLVRLKPLLRDEPRKTNDYSDYLTLKSLGALIPTGEHMRILSAFLDAPAPTPDHDGNAGAKNKRILLSGLIGNNLEFIKRVESLGVRIVTDDLCEWGREDIPPAEPADDPVSAVVRRILSRYCPAKETEETRYAQRLIDTCKAFGAEGVIMFPPRFCDPQSMEYAAAKPLLKDHGIPVLALEPVFGGIDFRRLETRLEAFLESL